MWKWIILILPRQTTERFLKVPFNRWWYFRELRRDSLQSFSSVRKVRDDSTASYDDNQFSHSSGATKIKRFCDELDVWVISLHRWVDKWCSWPWISTTREFDTHSWITERNSPSFARTFFTCAPIGDRSSLLLQLLHVCMRECLHDRSDINGSRFRMTHGVDDPHLHISCYIYFSPWSNRARFKLLCKFAH